MTRPVTSTAVAFDIAATRLARMVAVSQAFAALLAYAEASEPRAVIALGTMLAGAAFATPNTAAADVLRAASRRLLAAAGDAP